MINDSNQLSDRELEILKLVATGQSNQQIANVLGISVNTVKVHLRNVFGKIGVASRTEASMYAVRSGIVRVDHHGQAGVLDFAAPGTEVALAEPHEDVSTQADVPPDNLDQIDGGIVQHLPNVVAEIEPSATSSASEIVSKADDVASIGPIDAASNTFRTSEAVIAPDTRLVEAERKVRRRGRFRFAYVGVLLALIVVVGGAWIAVQLFRPRVPDVPAVAVPDAADQARWKTLSALPTPRAAFAIVSVADQMYIIGGENQTGVLSSVERYDVRVGRWAELSQKPTPTTDIQAVVLGGKVYVPGGRTRSSTVTDVFERYDPRSEQWEQLPKLPAPRSGYALAALEGKIYLFGGWDGSTYRKEVFEYDPDQARWRPLPDMPTARAFADAAVVPDGIYVLGGENETGPLRSNEVYIPAQEAAQPWARKTPLPQPRSRFGTAVALRTIHVIGGASGAVPIRYNVGTDSWESFAPAPQPIGSQPGVVLQEESMLILGGKSADQGYATTMQSYQLIFTNFLPTR